MALANYTDLQASIPSWNFNRADMPVTDLIALAEVRLNRDLRLRMMEVETTLTGVPSSRYIALPSDFLEPLDLWLELTSGRREMTYVTPDMMPNWPQPNFPIYWTVDGSNVAFEAPVDQAYDFTLRYLQRFALSDASPTNYLLTKHPDLYLAACNVAAAYWLQNDDLLASRQPLYNDALNLVNAEETRSRALAPMRVDLALQPRAMGGGRYNITRGW